MKQTAREIFINGIIFTADPENPYADSMIVEDGRIAWIGRSEDMPETDRQDLKTDLQGRRVIPGFVDAHMHPVMLADCRRQITVMPPEINSIEELVRAVHKCRERQGADQWVLG